jgi:hypothetical protein
MIMAQEQAILKAQTQLAAMVKLLQRARQEAWRLDELERKLFTALLAVGHTLLSAHVAAAGDGNKGATLPGEGHRLRRSAQQHRRRYVSIFGELVIQRYVYARRAGQKVEAAPLDEQLRLPAGDFSYVLVDWLERMCLKDSFAEAVTSLETLLGIQPSVRSAEQMNQHLAQRAEAFRLSQPPPEAPDEAEVLVVTADGKGVPMRRPLEERVRRGPRRAKGEKANKKQMAYVAAVYSIERFVRTADEVVDEVLRRQRASDRPVPQNKRVWAEMTRVGEGETCTGKERLFVQAALELSQRNPHRRKPLVCLLDGEAGLWDMHREWMPRAVGILDLFHVLEKLWAAAYCFLPEQNPAAETFVTRRLQMLLEGKVGYVIGGLKQLLSKRGLRGDRRRVVQAAIRYFQNNRARMRYDEYLAAGYPIGSGVAEGACRHLVKDRMERTGMRWTVPGAQALLHLRAIYLNGDWNDYLEYHIQTEGATLYGKAAA